MCGSIVINRSLCWGLLARADFQYCGINRQMKVFRDRWQFELKIVRHITPILVRLRQNLEGQFLILSNWYRLCCRTRVPRSSPGMLVAIIDESRPTSIISLGLRVVNLRCGDSATRGRGCLGGALVFACGRWLESRQALRVAFVALLFIASIAGVVLSSVFTEWWVSLLISVYMSWCLRFSPRFPASGSSLRAGPGGVEGVWPSLSLIGVAGCLGWV